MERINKLLEEAGRLEQRVLIRTLMHELSITRDKLATITGCTRRQIDTWILPEKSKGRRAMDGGVRWHMDGLLADHYLEKEVIKSGQLTKLEDAPDGYFSETSKTTYPAIYLAEAPIITYTTIEKDGWIDFQDPVDTGKTQLTYEFIPESHDIFYQSGYKAKYTQVSCLRDKTDYWISIAKIENLQEWEGFIFGFMTSPASFVDDFDFPKLLRTKHGMFACTKYYCRQSNTEKLKGMIVYSGKYPKENAHGWGYEEQETIVVLPNGTTIGGDAGWVYLRNLYDLELDEL